MGKNAYLLTSAIEIDNSHPFDIKTHNSSNLRSGVPSIERFKQTIYSVKLIEAADPTAKIYLVDTSIDYQKYESLFSNFKSVEYFPIVRYDKQMGRISNRHPCKAYSEIMLTKCFIEEKAQELKDNCDYIIKLSARYAPIYSIQDLEKDKFFTTKAKSWGPIDAIIRHNKNLACLDLRNYGEFDLRYYSAALFGFDISLFDLFKEEIMKKIEDTTRDNWGISYEMLLYYHLFPFKEKHVKETNWATVGFSGVGNVWSTA